MSLFIYFSICQTYCTLSPYLLWVLERAPELAQTAGKTWAEELIPAQAPAECKANVSPRFTLATAHAVALLLCPV